MPAMAGTIEERWMPISRVGTDQRINTTTAEDQFEPTVTVLADGRLLTTWYSWDEGDGDLTCIRARLFAADGSPLGADFIVNSTANGTQSSPVAAVLPDGRFVITWFSWDNGDGSLSCIRGRIFSSNGAPSGLDFIVNTTTESFQITPSITTLSDGRFVVAWQSADTGDGSSACVRARVYNGDGSPAGSDFILNSTAQNQQDSVDITALSGGRLLATWRSADTGDGAGSCVRGRIFNSDGTPAAADFIVNSTASDNQEESDSVQLSDGRILIVWRSFDAGDGQGGCIRARLFASNGTPLGADFILNATAANEQSLPRVALLADGRLAAVWTSFDPGDGDSACVRARILNSDGSFNGADFVVNTVATGFQGYPRVAALPDGRFTVVWDSDDPGDGSGATVRMQMFDPRVFTGTSGNDTWRGGALNDTISGDAGNDTLLGGGGSDIITGGSGNDGIDGGTGSDAALWSGARANYFVRTFVSSGQFFTQVSASTGTDGIDTLLNVETLGFGNRAYGLAGIQQNLVSNMDGERFDDVLFQNSATGQIAYINMGASGAGGFTSAIGGLPAGWRLVSSDDVSGDGRADLIVQDTTTGAIYTANIASGSVAWGVVATGIPASFQAIATGDVTRDGTADVLVRDNTTGQTYIADLDAGGAFGGWVAGPNLGTAWRTVGLGDFNGDGASDILFQNTADGTTYYRDVANQAWGLVSGAVGAEWVAREAADLNGDSYADVIFRNTTTGDIIFANMLGGGNAGWGVVAGGLTGWEVRGSADVDNDGWRDVIIQNTADGTTLYANMDNGTFVGWGAVSGAFGTTWVAVG